MSIQSSVKPDILCVVKYYYANSWELIDVWDHLEYFCVNA